MADVLDIYNSISESADKAIQKTSELLKQSAALGNIKPIAATLFHGALGPGMFVYDPIEKFVKGEATFAKASKDFIVDAKQTELGGKIAAKGIEHLGETTFKNSERIAKASQSIGKTFREWSSASKMMEGTIKDLAGKTGIMASSFRNLASVVKIATGPIATAIMATSTIYTQFVQKWMEDSDRLEARIRSTAGMFKDGGIGGIRTGMGQWTAQGGSRQEYLGLMGQTGMYGQKVGAQQATGIAELAKAIAIQTGVPQSEHFDKILEHFYTRTLQGDSAKEIEKERLQMRVLAGGANAGMTFRNPQERYQEWGEDVGTSLNRGFRGLAPRDIGRRINFGMPGPDVMDQIRGGAIRVTNVINDYAPYFSGPTGLLGPGIKSAAQGIERFRIGDDYRTAVHNLRSSQALSANPLESERERGRRLGLLGGIDYLSATRRSLDTHVDAGERELSKKEGEVEKRKQIETAYDMSEKAKEVFPKAKEEMVKLGEEINAATKSGDTEATEKALKSAEGLAKRIGVSVVELINMSKTIDNYSNEITKHGPEMDKYKAETEKKQKDLEALRKKTDAQRKTSAVLSGLDQLPGAGMGYKEIGEASYAKLEEVEKGLREQKVKDVKLIRTLQAKQHGGALSKDETTKLQAAKERQAWAQKEESGFTPMQRELYEKALATGDQATIKMLEGKRDPTKTMQRRGILAAGSEELRDAQIESRHKMANIQLPSAIGSYAARGVISEKEKAEIEGIKGKDAEYGSIEGEKAQMRLQEAAALHEAKLQAVTNTYTPRQRELQGQGIGATAQGLAAQGQINEKDIIRIQKLVKEGDEISLHHAQTILQLTQQRAQVEESILQSKIQGVQREGGMKGISLQMEAHAQKGLGFQTNARGDAEAQGEYATMQGIVNSGDKRLQDRAAEPMKNILSIREKMYHDEIAFTVKYTQARMAIIEAHYNNLNELEKGKLEQMDRKYAAHVQYGQAMSGLQEQKTQAQMGRYAGEDYWRGQAQGARGLKEEKEGIIMGAMGVQMPPEIQLARNLRDHKEREDKFKRDQARQKEEDTSNLEGARDTQEAIKQRVGGTDEDLMKFYSSEGGRKLLIGQMQKNQAARSRMGVDTSENIRGLIKQQEDFEAKKLVTSQNIQGRETKSLEEQRDTMEADIAGGKTAEGKPMTEDQKQRAQMEMAGHYKKLSAQYMATGEIDKAEEASKKQEQLLAQVPEKMKKDFGDVAKQQLNELQTQTGILNAINEVLGGKTPAEEGKGATGEEEEGEGKGKKEDHTGKFTSLANKAADKMLETAKRWENFKIKIAVQGSGAAASTSQGGGGDYKPSGS